MREKVKQRLQVLRAYFPLRLTGVLLALVASWVVFSFSSDEADYLLHPAGLVVLALAGFTLVATLLGTWLLRRALVATPDAGVPDQLETTRERVTGFTFPTLRNFLVLRVREEWVEPREVEVRLTQRGGRAEETIVPRLRGRASQVVRRFTVEDYFGLAAITFERRWDCALRIVPAPATCSAELASSRAQGDTLSDPAGRPEGDMVEMRSYAHGDSMRHVLWKTYARTRRLLVRLPERALSPKPVSIAFLVAGRGDEPSAGTARLFVEQGLLGPEFLFAADGADHPARTAAEALEQIVDSAAARHDGGAGLDALAAQVDPAQLAACLFFAPAIDGPWRPRLTALVHRLGLHPTVIIGVDALVNVDDDGPPSWERFLLEPPGDTPDERAIAKVGVLKGTLEAEGLKVQLVHRDTGQVL